MTNGRNFRGAAHELAAGYGRDLARAELDSWVAEEKDVVTAHLRTVLRPDPQVRGPLTVSPAASTWPRSPPAPPAGWTPSSR